MTTLESLAIQPNVYYTVEEAAQLLRVSKSAVLRLLRSGDAHGIRIGRNWRIIGANLLNLSGDGVDEESLLVSEWLSASLPSLMEVWDNAEDAVYDDL